MHELSARHGVRARVLLLKTDAPDVLATWGLRRPRILLPSHCESWSDARIRIVLSHELAHIRRADWPIQIAADAVIDAGVPPADYASQLVEIARICRPPSSDWAAALPIARPSTLEWRITAVMNPATPHRRPTSRIMALAVAAFVSLTIPIATGQVAPQSGPLLLEGSVYDISGAVLPQVAIRLEDASGTPRDATTDASGRFEFDVVEPGVYTIGASLPGFLTLRQEVTLRETRQWQRAITLQVGTVQERITVRDDRPAGAAAPTAAAGPLKVGGNIRSPRKLIDVRPEYPSAMRDGGFEGVVPMQVQIATDGSVAFVRVNSAQVHPELAQAAVDAVSQWRFSPTLLNGAAVEVFMTVTVQFSLQE